MSKAKETQITLGSEFRVTIVVTAAILGVSKSPWILATKLFVRRIRVIRCWYSKSRWLRQDRTPTDAAPSSDWMIVCPPETRFVFSLKCVCTAVVAMAVIRVRKCTFFSALITVGSIAGARYCDRISPKCKNLETETYISPRSASSDLNSAKSDCWKIHRCILYRVCQLKFK